jgi:hypothetical protein
VGGNGETKARGASRFKYPTALKIMKKLILSVTAIVGLSMACDAQTQDYQYTGSETTITLQPGLYDIIAYGAQGGSSIYGSFGYSAGGLGTQMEGQFYFSASTTLTLLVGGGGGNGGGGGGGGSFIVNGSTPLVIAGGGGGAGYYSPGYPGLTGTGAGNGGSSGAGTYNAGGGGGFFSNGGYGTGTYNATGGFAYLNGGGGGSGGIAGGGFGGGGGGWATAGGGGGGYSGGFGAIDYGPGGGGDSIIGSSAISILAEVSGVGSPDDVPNGEIIITAVPEPTTLAWGGLGGLLSLVAFRRRK